MLVRTMAWVLRKLGWPLIKRVTRRAAVALIPGVGLTLRLIARGRHLLRVFRLAALLFELLPWLLLPLRASWWLVRRLIA